jgi:hypothetical protein
MAVHLHSNGAWVPLGTPHAYSNGAWHLVQKIHAYGHGAGGWGWYEVWPGSTPPGPPPPGTYILSPSSSSIGDYSGYAEFDTGNFQGYITEIRIRISWGGYGNFPKNINVNGRPSGTFYRDIYNDTEWDGRTIDHRIDTFNAGSLTEFNNGSSIGFSVALDGGLIMEINAIQLVLTVG